MSRKVTDQCKKVNLRKNVTQSDKLVKRCHKKCQTSEKSHKLVEKSKKSHKLVKKCDKLV